jgi:hypothetical protein
MIPTTGRDDDAGGDRSSSYQTTVCPHCAHSAFPDEGVLRLAVVSSLFPQLAGASRSAYRVAFGLIVLLLVGLAVAGLTAPVIAVSALAIPLLFLIYLYEIAPRAARFAVPTAVIFLAGAALGAAWALLLGPVVADSLVPGLATSLTNGGVLASAVAVPATGQLLMLLPVAVAWLRRPDRSEALDGFTAGVASALGLTMAATLTELAPLLRAGNLVQGSSVVANLTEAVIRGISVPLVAAAATGYIGAALWSRRGTGSAAGGRWFTHPVLALMIALVVEIGLGYADDAVLPDIVLLTVHLAAAALALLALRIGLHYVLLHEQRDVRIGPPRVCPHCHRVVPAMPFCPMCGVAERATRINPHAPPASGEWAQDTATENAAAFPDASPEQLASIRHLGHRGVLAALIGGLALLTVVLVILGITLPPAPTTPCTSLQCLVPFGIPAHLPEVYTSAEGWSVQWYPASAVFSQQPPTTSASSSADQLRLDFTNPAAPAQDGQLAFVGLPAQDASANEIVTGLQQANAPNAVPDYVVPGASVGYMPGYGEAFQTIAISADGNPVKFEVVIMCAIRHGYAICAYAVGPQVDLNTIVNHPTEAKLALALWADPDLNGVRWKGESLP